jgi:hypothetical protein
MRRTCIYKGSTFSGEVLTSHDLLKRMEHTGSYDLFFDTGHHQYYVKNVSLGG